MDPTDMLIGFMSNLIVFPPIILIVLLFKRSKSATKRASRIDRGIETAVEQERFRKPSDGGQKREETEHDQDNNKGNFSKVHGKVGVISLLLFHLI